MAGYEADRQYFLDLSLCVDFFGCSNRRKPRKSLTKLFALAHAIRVEPVLVAIRCFSFGDFVRV